MWLGGVVEVIWWETVPGGCCSGGFEGDAGGTFWLEDAVAG